MLPGRVVTIHWETVVLGQKTDQFNTPIDQGK